MWLGVFVVPASWCLLQATYRALEAQGGEEKGWVVGCFVPVVCTEVGHENNAILVKVDGFGRDQVLEARGDEEKAVFDDPQVSRPEILKVVGVCPNQIESNQIEVLKQIKETSTDVPGPEILQVVGAFQRSSHTLYLIIIYMSIGMHI